MDAGVALQGRRDHPGAPGGGRTRVSVRSKSGIGRADFGQNARNIQLFLRELDQELFGVGSGKPL